MGGRSIHPSDSIEDRSDGAESLCLFEVDAPRRVGHGVLGVIVERACGGDYFVGPSARGKQSRRSLAGALA